MKVLFLTIDRSERVASHFEAFQRELARHADITFDRRSTAPLLAGEYCKRMLKGELTPPRFTVGDEFDIVLTDAPFAFLTADWARITKQLKGVLFEDMHGPLVRRQLERAEQCGVDFILYRYRRGFIENGVVRRWLREKELSLSRTSLAGLGI